MIYDKPNFGFEKHVNKLYGLESKEHKLQDLCSDWDAILINMVYNNIFKYDELERAWGFLEKAVQVAGFPAPVLMEVYEGAAYSVNKLVDEGEYSCLGSVYKAM